MDASQCPIILPTSFKDFLVISIPSSFPESPTLYQSSPAQPETFLESSTQLQAFPEPLTMSPISSAPHPTESPINLNRHRRGGKKENITRNDKAIA
jgi:hypothetical protein